MTFYLASITNTPSGAVFGSLLGLLVFINFVSRFILFVTAWAATAKGVEKEARPDPGPRGDPPRGRGPLRPEQCDDGRPARHGRRHRPPRPARLRPPPLTTPAVVTGAELCAGLRASRQEMARECAIRGTRDCPRSHIRSPICTDSRVHPRRWRGGAPAVGARSDAGGRRRRRARRWRGARRRSRGCGAGDRRGAAREHEPARERHTAGDGGGEGARRAGRARRCRDRCRRASTSVPTGGAFFGSANPSRAVRPPGASSPPARSRPGPTRPPGGGRRARRDRRSCRRRRRSRSRRRASRVAGEQRVDVGEQKPGRSPEPGNGTRGSRSSRRTVARRSPGGTARRGRRPGGDARPVQPARVARRVSSAPSCRAFSVIAAMVAASPPIARASACAASLPS